MKPHSIRARIITSFCLFSLLVSIVSGFFCFTFLWVVEDEFLRRTLEHEADGLVAEFDTSGVWPEPASPQYQIFTSVEHFPDDFRDQFIQRPEGREFFGQEGRHYHVVKLGVAVDTYLVAEFSKELVVRRMRRPLLIFWSMSSFVLTAIAFFIGYRIASNAIAPLSHLANLVENAKPNQWPREFASRYPDNEVGVLAKALEASLQRVSAFIEREQHFNRDASHELRTPIAVVAGAIELLKKSDSITAADRELVTRIDMASMQMHQTVQSLLALAREENDPAECSSIAVLPIAERIVIQFAYLLDEKDVDVKMDIDSGCLQNIQVGVLEILLSNLVSNAFQYTLRGWVNIKMENNILSVCNTGGSVGKNYKGGTGDSVIKSERSKGFGIGLSIVRRLCEHHHLKLHIEPDDQVTCVFIDFS